MSNKYFILINLIINLVHSYCILKECNCEYGNSVLKIFCQENKSIYLEISKNILNESKIEIKGIKEFQFSYQNLTNIIDLDISKNNLNILKTNQF